MSADIKKNALQYTEPHKETVTFRSDGHVDEACGANTLRVESQTGTRMDRENGFCSSSTSHGS